MTLEDRIAALLDDGPPRQIALLLGCSESYVRAIKAKRRDPERYRARDNDRKRERYATEPAYRARQLAWMRADRAAKRAKAKAEATP